MTAKAGWVDCPRRLQEDFVVVAPRCEGPWDGPVLAQFVRKILERPDCAVIDPLRLLVTGCGSGGRGAWAAAETGYFAAVVPVAATAGPKDVSAFSSQEISIWAF